jgi:hypothetical protein
MLISRSSRFAALFAGLFLAFSMVAMDHAEAAPWRQLRQPRHAHVPVGAADQHGTAGGGPINAR